MRTETPNPNNKPRKSVCITVYLLLPHKQLEDLGSLAEFPPIRSIYYNILLFIIMLSPLCSMLPFILFMHHGLGFVYISISLPGAISLCSHMSNGLYTEPIHMYTHEQRHIDKHGGRKALGERCRTMGEWQAMCGVILSFSLVFNRDKHLKTHLFVLSLSFNLPPFYCIICGLQDQVILSL